jgi:hypothetical protein
VVVIAAGRDEQDVACGARAMARDAQGHATGGFGPDLDLDDLLRELD